MSGQAGREGSWIICPRPTPRARLRLFCFPYAGGGASMFRSWADELPPEIEVYAAQLPGRESRLLEPPFTRLSTLAETLVGVLRPHLALPFAFFGHSMGALISFELARQMRRRPQAGPLHLFVSGHPAPQIPTPHPLMRDLPESQFVEELRRYGGTPEAVLQHPELLELFLPVLRADFALTETYTYSAEEPLECDISVFGGREDPRVSYDALLAWREQTRSGFTLRTFAGNHFFVQSSRAELLRAVSEDVVALMRRMQ